MVSLDRNELCRLHTYHVIIFKSLQTSSMPVHLVMHFDQDIFRCKSISSISVFPVEKLLLYSWQIDDHFIFFLSLCESKYSKKVIYIKISYHYNWNLHIWIHSLYVEICPLRPVLVYFRSQIASRKGYESVLVCPYHPQPQSHETHSGRLHALRHWGALCGWLAPGRHSNRRTAMQRSYIECVKQCALGWHCP